MRSDIYIYIFEIFVVILFILQVKSGFECGFSIEGYKDFEVDDVIECVKVEFRAKPLSIDRMSASSRGAATSFDT